mgnify:FL=1
MKEVLCVRAGVFASLRYPPVAKAHHRLAAYRLRVVLTSVLVEWLV